jgi:hypothetical protein
VSARWLTTLDEYVGWLEVVIDGSGAYLVEDALQASQMVNDAGEVVALSVYRHHLRFYEDGETLSFDLVVAARDLVLEEYHFDYRTADNTLIWRLDKHAGHEEDVGGLCHVHYDPAEDSSVWASSEYDIDDVIRLIHDGWRPTRPPKKG